MAYNEQVSIPKRDDTKYKEIENFKDFELINNAFYEMGIRSTGFKELTKKFMYCEKLSKKLKEKIVWDTLSSDVKSNEYNSNDELTFTVIQKTPEENFKEALQQFENNNYEKYDLRLHELVKLDYKDFTREIDILSPSSKTNDEIIEHYSYIEELLMLIPDIVGKTYYIDFHAFYYSEDDNKIQDEVEYEESYSTSQYTKREYKKNHYIETIIDRDNNTITRTLYPLTKRTLLINHLPRFSTNHLIEYRHLTAFLEDLLTTTQVKVKKQTMLANAFYCYDYYHYRLEEVAKENQQIEESNLHNVFLQEAIENIEVIRGNGLTTNAQKAQEQKPYKETILKEERYPLKAPTLHKTAKPSKSYIYDEQNFQKSGINRSTALKNYQWIKPYIDGEYINLINAEIFM